MVTQSSSSKSLKVVASAGAQAFAEPCILVIFGASGDLTKRLLMPAFYNLVCDGPLSPKFAILGAAMDPLTTDSFRERMSTDIKKFSTRAEFDPKAWETLCSRLYYTQGSFGDDATFATVAELVAKLEAQYQCKVKRTFLHGDPAIHVRPDFRQAGKSGLSASELLEAHHRRKNRSGPICRPQSH